MPVNWSEPPTRNNRGQFSPFLDIKDDLDANPGRWAQLDRSYGAESTAISAASRINHGHYKEIEEGQYEARYAKVTETEWGVWVRRNEGPPR